MSPSLPIFQLVGVLVRQLSKPLANRVKERAKSSHFFRTYICMPPAHLYHWADVNVKMKLLNLGKPVKVTRLNENAAIELGAELLGEFVIYIVTAGIAILAMVRSSRKATKEEEMIEERWTSTEAKLTLLEQQMKETQTYLDSLIKLAEERNKSFLDPLKKLVPGMKN